MSVEDGGNPEGSSAIAVIGMAGRFPGARDIQTFWTNLRAGVESIHRFTDEELLAAGESPELLGDPDYVKAGAQLADTDAFDAPFFGVSPRDAAIMDPQHRFFLEVAWAAFEDAGYVGAKVEGQVAVFATCGMNEYMNKNVLRNAEVTSSVGEWLIRHTANDSNFLATRASYELDLRGPSMNVQTACSSSLVAIHLACQSLLNGECELALAGGSTVSAEQHRGYLYKEGEILSPDGHCRAFDAKSAGTVSSSATGAVVLKRLSDALRDGDEVRAVIRGSATNNDGRDKVGYLAPSVSGQARVVSEALAVAGVLAREVSYVEAHGTGTLIGDPIEIAGLTQAFRQSTDDKAFCALGSLKTNMGHAGEAAGICGFIKTVLSLMHREIPPSLHFETPNPSAEFPDSPFFVNAKLRPWTMVAGRPRIAGVTGLGAGGTNVHLILEEAPALEPTGPSRRVQLLTLSAKSASALEREANELAGYLRDTPLVPLADIAFTRLAGRKAFPHRMAVVCRSREEALEGLAGKTGFKQAPQPRPSVAFLFPGGGAQYPGMARELYETERVFRDAVDACAALVNPRLGVELKALLYPSKSDEAAAAQLTRPSLALPALFATEWALVQLLESLGVKPEALIGHSAGEYVAACVAGVLSMGDALALVALRGRLFETLPRGGMLSVALSETEVRARLPEGLSLAARNAPALCAVSGPVTLLHSWEETLRKEEIDCARVHIDVAAHSSMLDPILAEFGAFCRTIRFSTPKIPMLSNLTGTWLTDEQATGSKYWVRHLREAVCFGEGIQTLLATGHRALVEVGPGQTLSNFARLAKTPAAAIVPSMRHPKEEGSDVAVLFGALARLWVAQVDLDPSLLYAGEVRRRVPLPTYPFEPLRYWISPDKETPNRGVLKTPLRKRPDVGDWFYTPSWHRAPAPSTEVAASGPWLVIGDRGSLGDLLISRLRQAGGTVVTVSRGRRFETKGTGGYALDPSRKSDWDALGAALRLRGISPKHVVHLGVLDGSERAKPTAALQKTVGQDYAGLLFLLQLLAPESEPLRLTVVTRGVHTISNEQKFSAPEGALLHGACRVIPREFPSVHALSIDIDSPRRNSAGERRLVDQLVQELLATTQEDTLALRGGQRWVRRFVPLRLESASPSRWMRRQGVYLITGGLGGIGLALAEHLARFAQARLVLVGRTPLPLQASWEDWLATHPDEDPTSVKIRKLQALRALGAEVMTASADVTDMQAMKQLVHSVHQRFGAVHGAFHAAGVLHDGLIALRPADERSEVIDSKVRGALVLDAALAREPLELLVLFSSVSSILGLPGQADYTAANAFLDSFAQAKSAEGRTRTVVVNWNAWQDVGMVVALASPATSYSRKTHWLLSEHVVRGGDALIPGTGFLELARAAAQASAPEQAIEIRDFFFLSPFSVSQNEARKLSVRLSPDTHEFLAYSDSESAPHVSGRVCAVAPREPRRHDLAAIRGRCAMRTEHYEGFSRQKLMDFGPRWGSLRCVDFGEKEALAKLEMPLAFQAELSSLRLHPALFDVATGCAQALIPGFAEQETFYVPFSYGRVLLRRALPARLFSHLRLRTGTAPDIAVFDVTLCDELGDEVAVVEEFVMRKLPRGAAISAHRIKRAPQPLEAALREGILSTEGMAALDRILGQNVGPQIVASSVDLHAWMAQVDAEARKAQPTATETSPTPSTVQFDRPNLNSDFVSPSTPLERELAAIWQELLGVKRVGTHDDFFELGGQSLVAVRLFSRIRKSFGVDLPIATLFESPTISKCAAVLGKHLRVNPEQPKTFQSLVPIREGGDRTPFFCVHGAGGNVLNFRDLSRAMDRAQPFYGLQAFGVDGVTPPHSTIEEMARAYLNEIRQLQPRGPYLLGGYSGGGLVALQMARFLADVGEDVALLVLLDTFHPGMRIRKVTLRTRLGRLQGEGFAYAKRALRNRRQRWRTNQDFSRIDALLEEKKPIPPELRDLHLTRNFERAAARYSPHRWSGHATLFRAEEVGFIYRDGGEAYGWEAVFDGGIEVVSVPGNHDNLLLEPHATVLVRSLSSALEAANRRIAHDLTATVAS